LVLLLSGVLLRRLLVTLVLEEAVEEARVEDGDADA
jgi:hypothetical protein